MGVGSRGVVLVQGGDDVSDAVDGGLAGGKDVAARDAAEVDGAAKDPPSSDGATRWPGKEAVSET